MDLKFKENFLSFNQLQEQRCYAKFMEKENIFLEYKVNLDNLKANLLSLVQEIANQEQAVVSGNLNFLSGRAEYLNFSKNLVLSLKELIKVTIVEAKKHSKIRDRYQLRFQRIKSQNELMKENIKQEKKLIKRKKQNQNFEEISERLVYDRYFKRAEV